VPFRVSTYLSVALLVTACELADPGLSTEFPDAGPGGPDSSFAGVGHGIPFGEFNLPPSAYGRPYTGAVTPANRSTLPGLLRGAQHTKTRLVLTLAGSRQHYVNPDGTFNLELWERQIDQYRDVDFSPYVTQGVVLAHRLVDEPRWPKTWGGRAISLEEIEAMARYSKSIWPSLPTAVGSRPELLRGFDWHYLDIAWAQWGKGSNESPSSPEQFRNENVAYAKELGLGLFFGLNVLDGGDGSSRVAGTKPAHWQMTATELQRIGATLANTPYACALFIWRYDASYERRPDIRVALDTITSAAAGRGGTSCIRHATPADSSTPGQAD